MITHDITIVEKQQESTPVDISSLKPLPETLPNIVKDLTPLEVEKPADTPTQEVQAIPVKKGLFRQITDMLGITPKENPTI